MITLHFIAVIKLYRLVSYDVVCDLLFKVQLWSAVFGVYKFCQSKNPRVSLVENFVIIRIFLTLYSETMFVKMINF